MLAGEKYMNPLQYYTGNGCSDNNSDYEGNDWDLNRWVPNVSNTADVEFGFSLTATPSPDGPIDSNCTVRFGSAHATVFHVVMCDGSVSPVNYSINLQIYTCMGVRKKPMAVSDVP
jgi:hypothetical protein